MARTIFIRTTSAAPSSSRIICRNKSRGGPITRRRIGATRHASAIIWTGYARCEWQRAPQRRNSAGRSAIDGVAPAPNSGREWHARQPIDEERETYNFLKPLKGFKLTTVK